jgi:hypothetical protein
MEPLDKQLLLTIFANMSTVKDLPEEKRVSRIKWIMGDLENEGIFDKVEYNDFEDADDFDEIVDAYCRGDMTAQEATVVADDMIVQQVIMAQQATSLERIRDKRKELSKIEGLGIVLDESDFGDIDAAEEITEIVYPYGRSPLHHAIAMMDLKSVEEMVKDKLHLDSTDNNGDTPFEMAFNQKNKAVLKMFEENNIL